MTRPSLLHRFFCLAVIALNGLVTSLHTVPVQASPASGDWSPGGLEAFFDEQVKMQMESGHVPGVAVAVVKDGTVLFSKGYGYSDLEQKITVDPERTLFRIDSITKLFTWTAVMQLMGQGKLDLDVDVNSYLDFSIPATYGQPITLRHLMAHTAGFEDRNYETAAPNPDRLLPLGLWLRTHTPARVRPPGELSAYSNYGAALAGYIVERVSGRTYEAYISENILQPLEMIRTSTLEPLPAVLASGVSLGYTWQNGEYQAGKFLLHQYGPAAAMSASAADMARFMIAHLQNGRYGDVRILSETTAQEMQSHLFAHDPCLNGFAYGFMEMNQNGLRVIGHTGSSPISQSILALVPEHSLGLFLAYNATGSWLNEKLLVAFLDEYLPGEAPALAASGPLDHASQVTGYYRSTRSSSTTLEKIQRLFSPFHLSASSDGHLLYQAQGKLVEFAEVAPFVFQSVEGDDFLVVRVDDQGRPTHLFHNGTPIRAYERLAWHENPWLHYGVLSISMLLVLLALPISGFWAAARRRDGSRPERPILEKLAWRTLLLQAFLALISVPIIGIGFINMTPFIQGEVTPIRTALIIPIVMTLLTVLMIGATILAWRRSFWGSGLRVYYTAATVASLLIIWFFGYWNLLGWNF